MFTPFSIRPAWVLGAEGIGVMRHYPFAVCPAFAADTGMNQFFTDLGRTVLARWKRANFSLTQFPDIARKALTERPPAKHVDVGTLIREFLLNDEQPYQTQSGFGQPELVVFDDPRFYIQILFWLEGTTDIHQHMFSGAFHVLAGSSIHSTFTFEESEAVTAHLRVGQVRMKETQLLMKGSTVPIISGASQIHSLFHLDTPSITVVIRTHSDAGSAPQFTYLPPHLAVDPYYDDALTARRKQLLDVLEQTGDLAYPDLVAKMVRDLDFERGMFILQNCLGHLRRLGKWEKCLQIFSKKHGRLAGFVGSTFDEIVRRDAMVELRKSIVEPEHRFFLALLLNVPTRADILRMVGERFAGNPVDSIVRWVEELTEFTEIGVWVLDANIPMLAGLSEDPSVLFAAFRALVVGASCSALKRADSAVLRDAFLRSSLRALVG